MGRPPKYKTAEELQKKIDEYFEAHDKYTISGLAYNLGFDGRQSFYDYEKKDEFSYTIKRARLRIEMYYEELLTKGGGISGSIIFALKNFGWTDKQEIEHSLPQFDKPPDVIINARNSSAE